MASLSTRPVKHGKTKSEPNISPSGPFKVHSYFRPASELPHHNTYISTTRTNATNHADIHRLQLWTSLPTISFQLARCEADNANPSWHAQFQGGSGRTVYESRRAELLARLPGEQAHQEKLQRELEQARKDAEDVSEEVKMRREERIRLDGY